MAALMSALSQQMIVKLPALGREAERYWREWCKPSYLSLAKKGPQEVFLFFEELGMTALNQVADMMQDGMSEDGAMEIVREYLTPPPEND